MRSTKKDSERGHYTLPLLSGSPPLNTAFPLNTMPRAPASRQQQRSPGRDEFKSRGTSRAKNPGTIAPGQPLPAGRQKDKFVPLPDDEDALEAVAPYSSSSFQQQFTPQIFEDLPQVVIADDSSRRGRVSADLG